MVANGCATKCQPKLPGMQVNIVPIRFWDQPGCVVRGSGSHTSEWSVTPVGCPRVLLNSDSVYLETASDSTA